MNKKYFITGIAGTGKSTVGAEFRKLGYEVYDIDAVEGLCHWKNKVTGIEAKYNTGVGKEWLEAHDWVCDIEKLKSLLGENPDKTTIIAGIAYNQADFLNLFDKVFLLHCSPEVFIERLNTRNDGNNFGKDKSEQEQIISWYDDFETRMKNLGAIPVSTERSLEEIVGDIKTQL
jgi:broad-specificity NMP kinase